MSRPQVYAVEKKPDEMQGMVRGLVGSYAGGTVGGMGKKQEPGSVTEPGQNSGSAAGAQAGAEAGAPPQSTALDRKMNNMSQDPSFQLQQGQAAAKRMGVEGDYGDTLAAAMERDRQEKLRQQSIANPGAY